MQRIAFTIILSILACSRVAFSSSTSEWAKDFEREPVTGPYSKDIDGLAASFTASTWSKIPSSLRKHGRIGLECYFDAEKKFAVGVTQYMEIESPFANVEKTTDDIDDFDKLFPDFYEIKILEKRGDRWLTYFEQSVPFPFSNVGYRMLYTISRKGDTKLYRYQLTWSDDVVYSDGLIAIAPDPVDAKKTRYFEIDFWDVKLGWGGALLSDHIRRKSIESVYVSDRAVQLKSERPDLKDDEIQSLAKKTLDDDMVHECLLSTAKFQPFWD